MIERLHGKVVARGATDLVLDVNGVGYKLEISLSTSQALAEQGERPVTVLTYVHLVVANDPSIRLFGFATEEERRLFRLLLPIKGVGPQTALRLLSSGKSVDDVAQAIESGDPKRIKAKRVGPKLAERIAIELKGKLGALVGSKAPGAKPVASSSDKELEDALRALVGLEFDEADARALLEKARSTLGAKASVEELVRESLRSA